MKKYLYIFSLLILYLFCLNCQEETDFPNNNTVYFYLSDSLENIKTNFYVNQDVFFHFGIINNQDSVLYYTKGHGAPPIVRFVIFKDDTVFGSSDEGYSYIAIVVGGQIPPHDTLKYSVSWYSNPYHQNNLEVGNYYTTVYPYILFDDFDLLSLLDTVYFEITE